MTRGRNVVNTFLNLTLVVMRMYTRLMNMIRSRFAQFHQSLIRFLDIGRVR